MHPELFEMPFIHRPVTSYGLMMVIAFLAAVFCLWIVPLYRDKPARGKKVYR